MCFRVLSKPSGFSQKAKHILLAKVRFGTSYERKPVVVGFYIDPFLHAPPVGQEEEPLRVQDYTVWSSRVFVHTVPNLSAE